MDKQNDGGPAFPWDWYDRDSIGSVSLRESYQGMSLRDWFAGHATDKDIAKYIPETVGELRDLFVRLGWIRKQSPTDDVFKAYGDKEMQRLRAWAKFQHADAMLAERDK